MVRDRVNECCLDWSGSRVVSGCSMMVTRMTLATETGVAFPFVARRIVDATVDFACSKCIGYQLSGGSGRGDEGDLRFSRHRCVERMKPLPQRPINERGPETPGPAVSR